MSAGQDGLGRELVSIGPAMQQPVERLSADVRPRICVVQLGTGHVAACCHTPLSHECGPVRLVGRMP